MATNINLTLNGLTESPLVSDNRAVTLNKLAALFKSLAGSEVNGTVSLLTTAGSVQATGTVTFSGAATAADTVTIAGTALTATKKNATGTASFSTIVQDNTVTIGGVTFTARTTPSATNPLQFALGADDTAAAANLAAAVNAYAPTNALVTATSAAGVVTFRAVTSGTGGNAITLAKVGVPITVSGALLTGGAAAANNQWDPGNTAATAAAAFAAAVNASSTAAVSGNVTASASAGVVTLTARSPGQGGNVTLAKSGTNIAVSGAALTGGALGTTTTISF